VTTTLGERVAKVGTLETSGTDVEGQHMFGRRRRRRSLERPYRVVRRTYTQPDPAAEPEERECPVCWGYGSVACRRCNETGDLDRTNDIDLDCPYCQGWGAITCTECGGSGTRR
jgi:hypothetical protein